MKFDRRLKKIYLVFIHPFSLNFVAFLTFLVAFGSSRNHVGDQTQHQLDIEKALDDINFMRNPVVPVEGNLPPLQPHRVDTYRCLTRPYNPKIYKTIRNNHEWQIVNASREIYLYNAYYDTRSSEWFSSKTNAAVQILAMFEETAKDIKLYCQFWKEVDDAWVYQVSKAISTEIWMRNWDPRTRFYLPVLISCPITDDIPVQAVSVTTQPCSTPSNQLEINLVESGIRARTNENVMNSTVVCVKGMDFLDDISYRLVEWIEGNLMFGADKIVFYTYFVHRNVSKVLEYYSSRGVHTVPLTLPGNMPNMPNQRSAYIKRNRQQKRRNELIPYNDCLYRHLYSHKYVLVVDIDELVVPRQDSSWPGMLDRLLLEIHKQRPNTPKHQTPNWTSFCTRNAFFFDNLTREISKSIDSRLHMLQHEMRSKKISEAGNYGKSFMYIPNIMTVFNHFPLHRLRRNLQGTIYIPEIFGVKFHFKKTCPIESRDECPNLYSETIKDEGLLKYRKRLASRVEQSIGSIFENL